MNLIKDCASRFNMTSEECDPKTARKIYSMSDEGAYFIKKCGRETVFGYRAIFACSANGFHQIPKICQGVKFINGEELKEEKQAVS